MFTLWWRLLLKFHLNTRKYIFTAVLVNYQNSLPKKLVEYPFVDIIKSPTCHGAGKQAQVYHALCKEWDWNGFKRVLTDSAISRFCEYMWNRNIKALHSSRHYIAIWEYLSQKKRWNKNEHLNQNQQKYTDLPIFCMRSHFCLCRRS